MRRRSVLRAIRMKKPDRAVICVLLLAFLFFAGGVIGHLCSKNCSESYRSAFQEYLWNYCLLYESGDVEIPLLRCVFLYFGNICLVVLLGFSALGLVLIPVVSGCFGFVSFYTASCFAQTFGSPGVFLAAALTALRLVFTLPCFFLMACEALPLSLRLALLAKGHGKGVETVSYSGRYFILLAICSVILCVGMCFERFLTPQLFQIVMEKLGFVV